MIWPESFGEASTATVESVLNTFSDICIVLVLNRKTHHTECSNKTNKLGYLHFEPGISFKLSEFITQLARRLFTNFCPMLNL